MKKKLAILLAIIMVMSALAGCGGSSGGSYKSGTTKKYSGNQSTCQHDWADATCTTPMTCKKCGLTKGNPNKHSYKAATCTEPEICRNCGAKNGQPLGHDYDSQGRCKRCDPYYTSKKTTTSTTTTTTTAADE